MRSSSLALLVAINARFHGDYCGGARGDMASRLLVEFHGSELDCFCDAGSPAVSTRMAASVVGARGGDDRLITLVVIFFPASFGHRAIGKRVGGAMDDLCDRARCVARRHTDAVLLATGQGDAISGGVAVATTVVVFATIVFKWASQHDGARAFACAIYCRDGGGGVAVIASWNARQVVRYCAVAIDVFAPSSVVSGEQTVYIARITGDDHHEY